MISTGINKWIGAPRKSLRDRFKPATFGRLLTHTIGLLIFFHLCVSRIFSSQFPGHDDAVTNVVRLIGVFLLIRNIGRRGTVRPSGWDLTYLLFFAANLMGVVASETFLVKRYTILANVATLLSFADCYLYFVILRECLKREGFSVKTLMAYWSGTYFLIMLIAFLQVMNVGGFGTRLDILTNRTMAIATQDGPSQPYMARGLMAHANNLASQMPFVIALCAGALYLRPNRPWYWLLTAGAFIMTFWTYSRTGLLVIFIIGFASGIFLLFRHRTKQAAGVLGAAILIVALGVTLVFALDLKKYEEIFVKRATSTSAADISVKRRAQMATNAIRTATDYSPVVGVTPADPGIQTIRGISQSAYNPRLVIFGQYANMYLRYGFVGLGWTVGIILCLIGMALPKFSKHPFAISAFIVGIALAIHGIAESLSTDVLYMIQVNLMMGLAMGVRVNDLDSAKRTDRPSMTKSSGRAA
jgi:hypothetical protein